MNKPSDRSDASDPDPRFVKGVEHDQSYAIEENSARDVQDRFDALAIKVAAQEDLSVDDLNFLYLTDFTSINPFYDSRFADSFAYPAESALRDRNVDHWMMLLPEIINARDGQQDIMRIIEGAEDRSATLEGMLTYDPTDHETQSTTRDIFSEMLDDEQEDESAGSDAFKALQELIGDDSVLARILIEKDFDIALISYGDLLKPGVVDFPKLAEKILTREDLYDGFEFERHFEFFKKHMGIEAVFKLLTSTDQTTDLLFDRVDEFFAEVDHKIIADTYIAKGDEGYIVYNLEKFAPGVVDQQKLFEWILSENGKNLSVLDDMFGELNDNLDKFDAGIVDPERLARVFIDAGATSVLVELLDKYPEIKLKTQVEMLRKALTAANDAYGTVAKELKTLKKSNPNSVNRELHDDFDDDDLSL
jgi:hypothetical protein